MLESMEATKYINPKDWCFQPHLVLVEFFPIYYKMLIAFQSLK